MKRVSRGMFSSRSRKSHAGGKLRPYVKRNVSAAASAVEQDAAGRSDDDKNNNNEVSPLSVSVCDEYKTWEYELQTRPMTDVRPLSDKTVGVLRQASETGDAFAEALYAKSCEITFAVKRARTTVLEESISQAFQRAAATLLWKDYDGTTVFDASKRTCIGTRLQALVTYGLAVVEVSRCLHVTIASESNAHFLVPILCREELPPFNIDMESVICSRSGVARGWSGTRAAPPDTIYRAVIPLPASVTPYEDTERQASLVCPASLSLVVGTLLTPLCSRLRTWKTLIVVSGGASVAGRPHLIDKVCADLVDLGVTTDFQAVVNCTRSSRCRPFVLRLEGCAWKSGDPEFLDQIHAMLKIGIIVVVRSDTGVPRDVCLQARLRLCTVHLRDVTVDEGLWQCHRGSLFQHALHAYVEWGVKVPRVPFRDPIEGHAFRPIPRRSPEMNATCCYLSEMLHMEYGIRLQAGATVDLFQIVDALKEYSRHRLVFDAPSSILPDDVLMAASDTREDRDRAVTYCSVSQTFRNLAALAFPSQTP